MRGTRKKDVIIIVRFLLLAIFTSVFGTGWFFENFEKKMERDDKRNELKTN